LHPKSEENDEIEPTIPDVKRVEQRLYTERDFSDETTEKSEMALLPKPIEL